jgi:hypothetical protein
MHSIGGVGGLLWEDELKRQYLQAMRAVQEWPSGVASIRRKRLPQNSLGIASLLVTYSAGAPLQRVQAQIRHKRCPYGLPHLFRFELELASVGALKGNRILLLIVVRSFLATKKQKQNRRQYSLELPKTNHCQEKRGFAYSPEPVSGPITNHLSSITSHGRDSGLAMRFQNLFLILPQCVDLGLLPVAAAFRAACDLKKILGSDFEIIGIRISQCKIRVFFGLR